PFIGSGTTAITSLMLNRHFVGYDVDPEYVKLADKRINTILSKRKQQVLQESEV
ncbi:DNA methylase N-4/N-6 domain protein, partial [mine drainage metagenome]